ncbi:MAG: sugar phosphate isomerase/epimerase [Saprospiraceae bacterium]
MINNSIRFGAEVYTWYMHENGLTHAGKLGHMIEITAQAGFKGIEPIHYWMGNLKDPARLKDKLAEHRIALAAIALCLKWNDPTITEDEKRETTETIELLRQFPGALLCLVQIPSGRHAVQQRRKQLLEHLHSTAAQASNHGIPSSFHPNSPHHSITRTEEDYDFLLGGLDPTVCGWTPDVGHIINGGMDPLQTMKKYKSLINHVHYKDWDGQPEFALMGHGKVDFVGITQWLEEIKYKGWIICEDEGNEAYDHPDQVTLHDGAWVNNNLIQI